MSNRDYFNRPLQSDRQHYNYGHNGPFEPQSAGYKFGWPLLLVVGVLCWAAIGCVVMAVLS